MNKLIAAAAACAVMLTGPAVADPPTGSRLGKRTVEPGVAMTKRDAAIAARDMARCLYHRRNNVAVTLLHAEDPVLAEAADRKLAGEVECFGMMLSNDLVDSRNVSFPRDLLRGGIAEAALARKRDEAALLQPLAFEQKRYVRPWFAGTARSPVVDEMATCIADTNPAGILALTSTEPESKAEASTFAALTPSLGQCLAAGAKLQASYQALRAALADALYQRVRNPALSLEPVEAAKK